MTISVANVGTNANSAGATVAVTVGVSGVAAGSLIVVAVVEFDTTSTSGTVADIQANTYTLIGAGNLNNDPAGGRGTTYYVKNATALVSGDTITYTKHTSGVVCAVSILSATGIDTSNPLDIAVTTIARGASATPSVTSGKPIGAGELFVGAVMTGGSATFTQDGSYSIPFNEATSGSTAADRKVDGGNLINASTNAKTYAPTFEATHAFVILIMGFKPTAPPVFDSIRVWEIPKPRPFFRAEYQVAQDYWNPFTPAPPSVNVGWLRPLVEVPRSKLGLAPQYQRAFAAPTELIPPPNFTGVLAAIETRDTALFGGFSFNAPVTGIVGVLEDAVPPASASPIAAVASISVAIRVI